MTVLSSVEKEKLASRAREIYNRKYRKELETTERGKVVAIEVESGEIFLGRTALEAGLKAREKYPDKIFYFIKVGYPAVHSLGMQMLIDKVAVFDLKRMRIEVQE
ncbi:MAG TPA: hypothetical protein ENG33_01190 [Chloroflexi bacterium]|nr:hypothetical protein [Chloroflexota bacterium]